MTHKWTRQPDGEAWPGMSAKIWICNVCGCKKILANTRFADPQYVRSHQVYGRYIECVNMAIENLKTID